MGSSPSGSGSSPFGLGRLGVNSPSLLSPDPFRSRSSSLSLSVFRWTRGSLRGGLDRHNSLTEIVKGQKELKRGSLSELGLRRTFDSGYLSGNSTATVGTPRDGGLFERSISGSSLDGGGRSIGTQTPTKTMSFDFPDPIRVNDEFDSVFAGVLEDVIQVPPAPALPQSDLRTRRLSRFGDRRGSLLRVNITLPQNQNPTGMENNHVSLSLTRHLPDLIPAQPPSPLGLCPNVPRTMAINIPPRRRRLRHTSYEATDGIVVGTQLRSIGDDLDQKGLFGGGGFKRISLY